MSTHDICFCREIRKILCGYILLSVAMQLIWIYTVCKGRTHPGSAGLGLKLSMLISYPGKATTTQHSLLEALKVLLTLDHRVPGSNPTTGQIQLMTVGICPKTGIFMVQPI